MFKINIKNLDVSINANKGDNLLRVLQEHQIPIVSSCGGNGTCKKCLVYNCKLKKEILSCQTIIHQDLELIIHDKSLLMDSEGLKTIMNIGNQQIDNQLGHAMIVDLGTTSIAMYLLDLSSGQVIDKLAKTNPQGSFGADVISRIKYTEKNGVESLNKLVIDLFNQTIHHFCSSYRLNKIEKVFISGNTTMQHIVMNINPKSLGYAPYKPVFLETKVLAGKDAGISCDTVTILPSISSFIGADISMGIISTNLEKLNHTLFIDLGTNGEIVLVKNQKLYAASTAIGPAFEGANLECGSNAISGAINRIYINDQKLAFKVIGNLPRTITGSAVIDYISIALSQKKILNDGQINHDKINSKDNKLWITDQVYISQKDIRQVQLAKSALISGVDTLLELNQLEYKDIEKIYIAGGFGFYLDINNAKRIGLLPKVPYSKFEFIGNSSARGAVICALSKIKLERANELRKYVNVIDLTTNKHFNDKFIDKLNFNT
ncbi:ASKHA domain-containing protein [Candidatus Izemoplasma sp. B36]|uniref:ASKHA domain-containing protein n=1 Tax=Candidatus Izemoplasma sp. B36 TaxID=3242468 RepID=UPI00355718B7